MLDRFFVNAQERSRLIGDVNLDRVSTFEGLESPIDLRVSDLEHIVPWLLCRIHGADPRDVLAPPPLTDSTSQTGSLLHTADMLFSMIIHNVQPEYVKNVAPTIKGTEHHAIVHALTAVRRAGPSHVSLRLETGWSAYMDKVRETPRQTRSLFDHSDYKSSGEAVVDEEYQAGLSLANAWAQMTERADNQWEFSPKCFTVREVSVLVPTKIGLRIKTRLDSVALSNQRGASEIQVIDLKTGLARETGYVSRLIAEHQGRLMELAGMVLLPRLGRAPDLESMVRGWPIGAKLNTDKLKRVRFGWRRFDQDNGTMETTWLDNTKEHRQEFYKWLKWFSIMMHRYHHEYVQWHRTHG